VPRNCIRFRPWRQSARSVIRLPDQNRQMRRCMPIDQLTAELELSPQVADFLAGQQFRASASTSPSIRSTIVLHRIAPVLTQHNPPAGDRRLADMHFAAPKREIGSLLQVSVLHVAEIPQRCPAAREIRQFSPVATHLLAFLTDVPYQRPPAAADGPTRCSRFGSGSVRLVTTSDDFAAKAGHKRRAQELLLRY